MAELHYLTALNIFRSTWTVCLKLCQSKCVICWLLATGTWLDLRWDRTMNHRQACLR